MTHFVPLTIQRSRSWDFPGSPVVKTALPLQDMRVQSLVGELRSLMLRSVAKKKKKKEAGPIMKPMLQVRKLKLEEWLDLPWAAGGMPIHHRLRRIPSKVHMGLTRTSAFLWCSNVKDTSHPLWCLSSKKNQKQQVLVRMWKIWNPCALPRKTVWQILKN